MNHIPQFKILSSASSIYIENTSIKQAISIERKELSLSFLDSFQEILNSDITSVSSAEGILGIMDIDTSKYVLIITESRQVCQFLKIEVKSIKSIDLVLISQKEAKPQSKELIRRNLQSLLLNGFYYSNGYDITRTMQEKGCNAINSKDKRPYHSIYNCNKDYMWNYNLLHLFLNYNIDERFLSCCIYGYISKIAKTFESIPLEYTLISKRLVYNYSLYNRDFGLMELPNHRILCHNFIETECISQVNGLLFSLVFYSSTIPVYSNKTVNETCKHFGFYINNIYTKYNKAVLMTLYSNDNINNNIGGMISNLLEQAIYIFKSNFLRYIKLDSSTKLNYDAIVKDHSQVCDCFGFYGIFPNRIIEQKGVFYLISNKTYHSDNLNELMMAFSWHFLSKQLSLVIPNFHPLSDLSKVTIVNLLDLTIFNQQNNVHYKESDELKAAFREIWAKNRKALDYEKNPPTENKVSQLLIQKTIEYLLDDNTIKRNYSQQEKLNIFIGTWNSAGIDPISSYDLSPWFTSHNQNPKGKNYYYPDLILIGMQEVVELNLGNIVIKSNEDNVRNWSALIYKGINKAFPNIEYIPVKRMDLVGIMFLCYIKKGMTAIERDSLIIKTGALGTMGNKGSCLFSLTYHEKSIAFATGHFCAGQKKVNERIEELNKLLNTTLIDSVNDKIPFKQFPNWFIFGDINFRVNLEYNDAINHLKQGNINHLLHNDQLSRVIDKAFQNVNESPIKFKPTYQYVIESDEFESKKLRIPSWCDRILYKNTANVKNIEYNIVNHIKYSDHRPIYAIFELTCTKLITNEKEILLDEMRKYDEEKTSVFKLENAYICNANANLNLNKGNTIIKPQEHRPVTSRDKPINTNNNINLLDLTLAKY